MPDGYFVQNANTLVYKKISYDITSTLFKNFSVIMFKKVSNILGTII